MSRPILVVTAGALALLLAIAFWLEGDSILRAVLGPSAVERDERGPLGDVELAAAARDTAATSADVVANEPEMAPPGAAERTAVGGAPAPIEARRLPIRGQVLDRFGLPAASVEVRWAKVDESRDGLRHLGPGDLVDVKDMVFFDARWHHAAAGIAVRTDDVGWFEFAELDARSGGELVYGAPLYLGEPPHAPVDITGADHYLTLPSRGDDAPHLVVKLSDAADGSPLLPATFELELLEVAQLPADQELPDSITSRGSFRREVDPACVHTRLGEIRVARLAPGKWRMLLRGDRSEFHSRVVEIPVQGDDVVVELALANYETAWFETKLVGNSSDDLAPERSTGFADYADHDRLRPLGNREPNRHFTHTLRDFGVGPLSGAMLELQLEAVPDACHNDAISLEFVGAPQQFAWSGQISYLVGSTWSVGSTAHLVLDLASLPTRGGAISILELLEDGALDVYVQDDTVVHRIALHVRP